MTRDCPCVDWSMRCVCGFHDHNIARCERMISYPQSVFHMNCSGIGWLVQCVVGYFDGDSFFDRAGHASVVQIPVVHRSPRRLQRCQRTHRCLVTLPFHHPHSHCVQRSLLSDLRTRRTTEPWRLPGLDTWKPNPLSQLSIVFPQPILVDSGDCWEVFRCCSTSRWLYCLWCTRCNIQTDLSLSIAKGLWRVVVLVSCNCFS